MGKSRIIFKCKSEKNWPYLKNIWKNTFLNRILLKKILLRSQFSTPHCHASSSSKYVNCANKVSKGVVVLPKSHTGRFHPRQLLISSGSRSALLSQSSYSLLDLMAVNMDRTKCVCVCVCVCVRACTRPCIICVSVVLT